MTDLPLPEPAAGYGAGCNIELTIGQHLYTADQLHAYAAAKTAALQAELAAARAELATEMNDAELEADQYQKCIRVLEAECARLRGSIEAAARYGWEHDRWQWSAVKGGLDRFTDAALRGKETP